MAGITDQPFRNLCRELGAGHAVSEMISSDLSLVNTRKTRLRMNHNGESAPIHVQIAGSDPEQMARAAKFNVKHGAQIIDINMGCPAKKVCNKLAGSSLLQDEHLVQEILEAVVDSVDVPVTLKTRTGWSLDNRNAVKIGRIAEAAGIACLTLHGRTRNCFYSGEAEFETFIRLRDSVSIPLVANGDISGECSAQWLLEEAGANAVMIGRAAQVRPWLPGNIAKYLSNATPITEPNNNFRSEILLRLVRSLHEFYGPVAGTRMARKHIVSQIEIFQPDRSSRQGILKSTEPHAQLELLEQFLNTAENQIAA